MSLRVVLDTNVVVSALVFAHGRLTWIRNAWMDGRLVPLASRATVEQLLSVLSYPKFQLTSEELGALLADYLPFVETADIEAGRVAVPEPRDPADRMLLELAIAGKAEYLVPGDKALLEISDIGSCRIVPAVELRAVVEGTRPGSGKGGG